MPEESFTVVALPYSRSESRSFSVSLFVSPDLVPDGAEGVLGDFPHWVDWTAGLPSASIALFNQSGQIGCEALLDDLDPSAWESIFPPDTPVRGRTAPDWDDRHWRTFRAAEVHDTAKMLSFFSMATSPTSLPKPDPEGDLVTRLMTSFIAPLVPTVGRSVGLREEYDESVFTRMLDQAVSEPHASDRESPESLEAIEKTLGRRDGFQRAVLELHRARRFYERPEAQSEYQRRPDGHEGGGGSEREDGDGGSGGSGGSSGGDGSGGSGGAGAEGGASGSGPRPSKPEPDFHERVSLLGDHPGVLRSLGLVVDLRVDDLTALEDSDFLRAVVKVDDGLVGRAPETAVRVVGSDLVVPSPDEEWSAGRLRLGDEDLYRVLDMDVDGGALKTDRFLWTVPRLVDVQESSADASTAPPAQRTGGFTIARTRRALETRSRMEAQKAIRAELVSGTAPRLGARDVIQGLRLEVWDDAAGEWYSLHRRRVDVEVLDHGMVLEEVEDEGFVQGTTASETTGVEDSPVHVHEAVASWGGWSLSAARPGKRVVHESGDEVVEETTPPEDPSTPVIITSTVQPGTLPRLRYGRSYAFRAWAVDLAGNSRPHDLKPGAPEPSSAVAEISAALGGTGDAADEAADALDSLGGPRVARALRSAASATVLHRRTGRDGGDGSEEPTAGAAELEAMGRTAKIGDAVVPVILGRLKTRRIATATRMGRSRTLAPVSRSSLVDRAFGDLMLDTERSPLVDVSARRPEVIAAGMEVGETPTDGIDTVTPLRPFLRWEPVQPPTVVARHGNSPGESLLQLVIRSGVVQDRETLEVSVTSPEEFAVANPGHRYRATSERHLAPPKTSQSEAELHGAFDFAIGSTDPEDHAAALAWIVRESGTWFDVEVHRLDDPHTRDPQPGIALVKDPGTPDSTLKELPLDPGEMPAPGQYVIHDVDELSLPYLPDPVGRGIALVFPDAGRDRQLQFPFGGEGFTARYGGDWPALEPFRLVLTPSEELGGDLTGRVLSIGLPPGDTQRFRLSSSLDRKDLDLFGLWRLLPPSFRSVDEVAEAAADGWLWAFTPFDEVTLVHAVPRPLEAPRPTQLRATRPEGSTDAFLSGAVDVHGPSTEQLTAAASWTEHTDELSLPGPEESERNGIGFLTTVRPEEDLAVLFGDVEEDARIQIPGFGPVWLHRAVHQWGDTKHRRVTYQFRASTRFREYFHPDTLAPEEASGTEGAGDGGEAPGGGGGEGAGSEAPGGGNGEGAGGTGSAGEESAPLLPDDGQSVVGPRRTISIPSSAKPAAPVVHSVLPLFRWETGTEPEQPLGTRRTRRAGVRVYLERPWYSSGEGELLGVLVAPGGIDTGIEDIVSQWGQDPVWRSRPVQNRAMALELDDLMHVTGLDDRPDEARPVTRPTTLPYAGIPGRPSVTVLGYEPEYNHDRGLWYVDVAIDPGDRIWPFVRLAVARYQPESITGCELSQPVKCDYQQLLPERTASVARTDSRHVRVVVSGAIGTRGGEDAFPPESADRHESVRRNRIMVARLQKADPDIPTDLGWDTIDTVELIVRGTGRTDAEAAWVGELEAPEEIPVARPGENPDWQVTIEEWELLPGDPDPDDIGIVGRPSFRRRIVYAESLRL